MSSKKKSYKDTPDDFIKVLEKQRKEMERLTKQFFDYPKQMEKMVKPFLDYQQRTEKMTKPILEYQQKLLGEFKKFQEAWVQNAVETMERITGQVIEEQTKLTEEANRLMSEMKLPDKVTEFMEDFQKIQGRWAEQLKKATEFMESFMKKVKK